MRVVIIREGVQLSRQVDRVPEEHVIEIFAADGADQPFNERVRDRGVRNRLDLLDLADAQVGEPAVEAKERVMVGADVFRWGPASNCVIEHPTYRDAVDICTLDAKTDDAAGEHVHDYQHPVTAQEDGFAAEQVDAPQAVLDVPDECQPRGVIGSGVAWREVLREHAAHDIFVDVEAEGMRDLLGDAYTAEPGVAALQLNDRRDEFCRRTFGAGFMATVAGGKEQTLFPIHQGLVELEQRCRLDERAKFLNPTGTYEQRGQPEHAAIERGQIRRTLSGSIADEKLVFENQRLCGDGTYTTRADQLSDGDQ